jgi:hypothetical protein
VYIHVKSTKRQSLCPASFGIFKMNEWAARILSVFPERTKADLDEFIVQVRVVRCLQKYCLLYHNIIYCLLISGNK